MQVSSRPWVRLSTILEWCIALELRAKRIYRALAKAFNDQRLVGPFFAGLAEQEQYHADLLEIVGLRQCVAAGRPTSSTRGRTICPASSSKWTQPRPPCAIDSVDAALQLVIQIESSEINEVFMLLLPPRMRPL